MRCAHAAGSWLPRCPVATGSHCLQRQLHCLILLPDAGNSLLETLSLPGTTRSFKFAAHQGKLARADKVAAQAERVCSMRHCGCIRMLGRPLQRGDQPRRIGKIAVDQPGYDSGSSRALALA